MLCNFAKLRLLPLAMSAALAVAVLGASAAPRGLPVFNGAPAAGGVKGTIKTDRVTSSGATSQKDLVVYLVPKAPIKPTPPAAPVKVVQKQMNFEPHVLPVVVGTKVAFENADGITHNVQCKASCCALDSDMEKGGSMEKVYDTVGSVEITCRLHPEMVMYVVTVPSPYFSSVSIAKQEADGKSEYAAAYSLTNVPPGEYTLKTWNKKLPETSRDVVIAAGETLQLDFEIRK